MEPRGQIKIAWACQHQSGGLGIIQRQRGLTDMLENQLQLLALGFIFGCFLLGYKYVGQLSVSQEVCVEGRLGRLIKLLAIHERRYGCLKSGPTVEMTWGETAIDPFSAHTRRLKLRCA